MGGRARGRRRAALSLLLSAARGLFVDERESPAVVCERPDAMGKSERLCAGEAREFQAETLQDGVARIRRDGGDGEVGELGLGVGGGFDWCELGSRVELGIFE